eukprot:11188926-Lingulodinium_polyedra.AAC.1
MPHRTLKTHKLGRWTRPRSHLARKRPAKCSLARTGDDGTSPPLPHLAQIGARPAAWQRGSGQ